MRSIEPFVFLYFVILSCSSCATGGYQPSYIISDHGYDELLEEEVPLQEPRQEPRF